jgi:nucleotide-binding universal stress UspA family protein
MKRFIIPVDFSETSRNAARFAASFSASISESELILYNAFDGLDRTSDGRPTNGDEKDKQKSIELALKGVDDEVGSLTQAEISLVAEESGDFVDSLESCIQRMKPDMIIMGITGANRLERIIMGSNTLNIVRKGIAPVVIVPPEARFKGIRNIMLISDFRNVELATPIAPLTKILDSLKPNLHIVHVAHEYYEELTDENKSSKKQLDEMLKDYNPEFYFIKFRDFTNAVNEFVQFHDIDLIVTIPKDQSFFPNLFKTTHTSQLAYHSHVPIIALHGSVMEDD